MVKMRILRNTVAAGQAFEAGDVVDLSKKDADILRVRGKAEMVDPVEEELPGHTETATAEPPENAMQKPPRRGTGWTPERRAAAAERARKLNEAKRQAKGA